VVDLLVLTVPIFTPPSHTSTAPQVEQTAATTPTLRALMRVRDRVCPAAKVRVYVPYMAALLVPL